MLNLSGMDTFVGSVGELKEQFSEHIVAQLKNFLRHYKDLLHLKQGYIDEFYRFSIGKVMGCFYLRALIYMNASLQTYTQSRRKKPGIFTNALLCLVYILYIRQLLTRCYHQNQPGVLV